MLSVNLYVLVTYRESIKHIIFWPSSPAKWIIATFLVACSRLGSSIFLKAQKSSTLPTIFLSTNKLRIHVAILRHLPSSAVVRAVIPRILPSSQPVAQSNVQPSSASYPAPSQQRSRTCSHLTQLLASSAVVRAAILRHLTPLLQRSRMCAAPSR